MNVRTLTGEERSFARADVTKADRPKLTADCYTTSSNLGKNINISMTQIQTG